MVSPSRQTDAADSRSRLAPATLSRPTTHAIAEVAVNAPLRRLFHYRIPGELAARLHRGHRVLVPFGHRSTTGVCVGFPAESAVEKLKPIRDILHPECHFDEHLLELTRWIAMYYQASWGEVLEAALPPGLRSLRRNRHERLVRSRSGRQRLLEEAGRIAGRAPAQARLLSHLADCPGPHRVADLLRDLGASRDSLTRLRERGLVDVFENRVEFLPLDASAESSTDVATLAVSSPLRLHVDQEGALAAILEAVEGEGDQPPPPFLLFGVTGSGKTEVYLRALHRVLERGGRGLVLVPEISLTPQTVKRFRDGLPGARISVVHSMLSGRERAAIWREIQAGRVGVVIGARSAVFSPIPALRLIVCDEEHEPSYKQESSPRYNGRDAAILRARLLGIPIVLGSATPSLESYHNACSGKYRLLRMPRRATAHQLPKISVQPLQKEFYRPDGSGLICGPLDHQIRLCLKRGEQAILFLNRRGFSTFLHCLSCGLVLRCQRCDITLTYHRREDALRCHYCDSRYALPRECPDCQHPGLRRAGVGTEKVAEVLASRYRGARVGRLDRDTVKNASTLRATLESFAAGEIDVLVGTQMLAKGHDFPRVSLVGIISADTGLHFPDFRAAERTFQIITQVAGRAGRGDRPGCVILQTFFPDHHAIRFAVENDYESLYETEAEHRRALNYPPFGRIVKVLVQDAKVERATRAAEGVARRLRAAAGGEGDGGIEVLGPAPAPITRIQEKHRFQILIKATTASALQRLLARASVHEGGRIRADIVVDVDPQSML